MSFISVFMQREVWVVKQNMHKRLSEETFDDETNSSDGSVIEMSDLSASLSKSSGYGSTPVQGKKVDNECLVPVCGVTFYFMIFLSILCSLMMRVSLSEAIEAMVNHTAVDDQLSTVDIINDSVAHYCPKDLELDHENGEFVWYSYEQGSLLAAYYYGYVLTQVRAAS